MCSMRNRSRSELGQPPNTVLILLVMKRITASFIFLALATALLGCKREAASDDAQAAATTPRVVSAKTPQSNAELKRMEGVYQTSREGRFLSVNPAFVELLGFDSAEELYALGEAASLYVDPADRVEFVRRIETDGEVHNAEYQLRRKDGRTIVVLESARVVRNEPGDIIGYEGTIADITERWKAETAVFEEKERAQVTLQSIGDGVITTDADGCVNYVNPVAESLTGWDTREANGLPVAAIFRLINETDREAVENPVVRCLREARVIGLSDHTVLLNRRGQEIAIQNSAAPIRDRAGNVIGAVMSESLPRPARISLRRLASPVRDNRLRAREKCAS